MIVGPRTAIAKSSHDARAVPIKWHGYSAVIVRQSHGDRPMIVRPQYNLAFLRRQVSLSFDVFWFYTSQLKMISCTRLINKILKVHVDHTAIEQSRHGLRTRVARVSCDIRAISMYRCGDSTMTARSPYDLRTFCLRLCTGPLKKPVKEIARWPY